MKTRKFDLFSFCNNIFIILCIFACLFPLWYIFVISVSTVDSYARDPYHFWPHVVSFAEYARAFQLGNIPRSLVVSIIVTVVGTFLSLLITLSCAYAISHKQFSASKVFSKITIFPMLFSGGMIPFYIVVTRLGLSNTLFALFLPTCISVYNLMVAKSFMSSIDPSMEEAAKIDGASDLRIFTSIILPVSKPLVTTLGMFYAIAYYNDFFNAMFFITKRDLYPIQMLLREMIINNQAMQSLTASVANAKMTATEPFRMACVVIGVLPILLVYPFVQRNFAKGVMLGAVKG